MIERSVVVKNPSGLHARPAAVLIHNAERFPCELSMVKGLQKVDLKSILGVMSLAVSQGDTVIIRADGQGESEAVEEISRLIESGLGE